MADLILEFFKRDLNENEMEELGRLLERSPEEALRFGSGMEKLYLGTGYPLPKLPKGLKPLPKPPGGGGGFAAGGMAGATKITLLALMVTGAGLSIWKYWLSPAPASTAAVGIPTVAPNPPSPRATVHHAALSLPPIAAGPKEKGDELSIFLDSPQRALVTVRILDFTGAEVRQIYAGFVESGRWQFKWDGLLSGGETAPPGSYRIEVRSGAKRLEKTVQIKSNQP